ncbi:MAG: HAMP domain-containing histidine kinase [Desulfobacterales bacterium]|nr:HAMP domain-containing histidine kinase [Desulfobacterales bacterium]
MPISRSLIFHPIFVFIYSIIALATSLTLYIYWYIEVSSGLKQLVQKFNLDVHQVFTYETWVVIMVLSILVAIILLGIFIIFIYHQKTFLLYRMQNNFINNFTHELKTPVTSMKLYIETFLSYELPRNDQMQYLHYMLNDIERLSENINRILQLAKIESKAYQATFTNADIVKVFHNYIQNRQVILKNCLIQLYEETSQTYNAKIDIYLFEMLINNLITNALKYTKHTVPQINIFLYKKKKRIEIVFQDNGVGIQKKELRKIFKKFYQVGKADNMTARGSGIGLYLVQIIARLHKGKVFAKSEGLGKGTCFTLILPSQ